MHVGGVEQGRLVQLELDILAKNNDFAARNRPLVRSARRAGAEPGLQPRLGQDHAALRDHPPPCRRRALAVIEGDQQTANDAECICATGAPAVQINTGKGCHLMPT